MKLPTQALRHSLLAAALLAVTGITASAQICPAADMYESAGSVFVPLHGNVSRLFELSEQQFQSDHFDTVIEPRSTLTWRFEGPGEDLRHILAQVIVDPSGLNDFSIGVTAQGGVYTESYVNDLDRPLEVSITATYDNLAGGPSCTDYSMRLTHTSNCGTDDIREEDDFCFSATPLLSLDSGVEYWQISQPGDDDWFSAWLEPGQTLDLSTYCSEEVADLDLRLYRANGAGCGAIVEESVTSTPLETLNYTNLSGNLEFVAAEVTWAGSPQNASCAVYSVTYQLGAACAGNDILEPNNDLCGPALVSEGVFDGASVHPGDPDFYRFTPVSGYDAVFAVEFDESLGELELEIYSADSGPSCQSYGSFFVGGIEEPGYEEQWIASGGGFNTFILAVRNVDNSTGCAPYRLTVASRPPSTLGDTVCFTGTNSTGFQGEIYAFGSDEVSANSLSLQVAGTTPSANGFFLVSRAYGVTVNPGGALNNLCIAGAGIGRYVGPGQIQTADGVGNASLQLDLTQTPQPSTTVSIQPGESWYFQYWHRDSFGGQPRSAFTSAARVRFR